MSFTPRPEPSIFRYFLCIFDHIINEIVFSLHLFLPMSHSLRCNRIDFYGLLSKLWHFISLSVFSQKICFKSSVSPLSYATNVEMRLNSWVVFNSGQSRESQMVGLVIIGRTRTLLLNLTIIFSLTLKTRYSDSDSITKYSHK